MLLVRRPQPGGAEDLRTLDLCGRLRTTVPAVGRPDPFPSLRRLSVAGCNASESQLSWVAWARGLEELDASANALRGVPPVHPESKIKRLDISWNSVEHDFAAALDSPPFASVGWLDVSNNDILDYGAMTLIRRVGPGGSLPGVTFVAMDHNQLSASAVRWLTREKLARLSPRGVNAVIGNAR